MEVSKTKEIFLGVDETSCGLALRKLHESIKVMLSKSEDQEKGKGITKIKKKSVSTSIYLVLHIYVI